MRTSFHLFVALVAVVATSLQAQTALRIISPPEGTVVHPGDIVTIDVSVSGVPLAAARIAAQDPIRDSQILHAPPFQFQITIPSRIRPGPYALVADGGRGDGKLVSSDPLRIDVERPDTPQSIRVEPGFSPVDLPMGIPFPLQVIGTYLGGEEVGLSESTRTTYEADPPGIVSVTKEGLITGLKRGSATIIIRHGEHKVSVQIVVGPAPK